MNASALWIALLVAGALVEVLGRLYPNRVSTLKRVMSVLERRIGGRALLIALWLFVGFHLFARYTIPHS